MAQTARNEERFITILEDNKRIVADMKEMRKIQDEQKAKCERNAEKLEDLRGSHKDLAIPLPSLQRQRQIGALFHLAHREAALLEQLATHTAHLRSRQLAAAFATLESQSP